MTDTTAQLDYAAVADLAGVKPVTLRKYAASGRMPVPDGRIGGSPWWHEATITAWLAGRPGQGVGGGRPSTSGGQR